MLQKGAFVAGALLVGSAATGRADQAGLVPVTSTNGPVLTFDWPAIEVGFGSYEAGQTGLTIHPGVFSLAAQGAGRMAMQGGFFGCDAILNPGRWQQRGVRID